MLDAETGEFVWNTLVGPGGDQGGFEWGTAYDGDADLRLDHEPAQHPVPADAGRRDVGPVRHRRLVGGARPGAPARSSGRPADPVGAYDLAPVTSANGVVYASSMPQTGDQMFALDGEDRRDPLAVRRRAAPSTPGPSVVDGTVYWGSGYDRRLGGNGNNKLFAFSIDGK